MADPHSDRGCRRRILPCSRGGTGRRYAKGQASRHVWTPLEEQEKSSGAVWPWSGADMCAAFDAAHTPQARMGVRGSGPIQAHALEALVVKLVFQIPSLDRRAIPLL